MKPAKTKYGGLSIDLLKSKALDAGQFLSSAYSLLRDHNSEDISRWRGQTRALLEQSTDTKSLIGIVGATGAGKSALINSLLDEECILPADCMRACTAVPIEITYNYSDSESRYEADIDFLSRAERAAELKILLKEILDGRGNLSKDCEDGDTDAGVALSKLQAVYTDLDKNQFVSLSDGELLNHEAMVKLNTTTSVREDDPDKFQSNLRHYVDAGEKKRSITCSEGSVMEEREVWPLIRAVRLHVKSKILKRGVQLVDLPGVHDSNAGRAALAQAYLKRCSGMFVVSTINRAVDDKSAHTLLGDAFKQQLKLDGNCGNITFVCTQTDHISIAEVTRSLNLSQKLDPIHEEVKRLKSSSKSLQQDYSKMQKSLQKIKERLTSASQESDRAELLMKRIDRGELVTELVISEVSRKRRRTPEQAERQKKRAIELSQGSNVLKATAIVEEPSEGTPVPQKRCSKELSKCQLASKIAELKASIIAMKQENVSISEAITSKRMEEDMQVERIDRLNLERAMICIKARNEYSRQELKSQFATAMRQLDEQATAESTPDNFDPSVELQDSDKLAEDFPVFCVSSRAYQKLNGRLPEESEILSFSQLDETEIPQLQEHCCIAADTLRADALRRCLNGADVLRNALKIFALDSSHSLTTGLTSIDIDEFAGAFADLNAKCVERFADEFRDRIFCQIEPAARSAEQKAVSTSARWGAPVDTVEREKGGLHWKTYLAVVRRLGCYGNRFGTYDFNKELAAPMINRLLHDWDVVFHRRIPAGFEDISSQFKEKLSNFMVKLQGTIDDIPLQLLTEQLEAYATKAEDALAAAEIIVNDRKKDVHRSFEPVIREVMSTTYDQCATQRGVGTFIRMKSHMAEGVTRAKDHMFKSSTNSVPAQLQDMLETVDETLQVSAEQMRRDIQACCTLFQADLRERLFQDQKPLRDVILRLVQEYEGGNEGAKSLDGSELQAEIPSPAFSNDQEQPDPLGTVVKIEDVDGMNADDSQQMFVRNVQSSNRPISIASTRDQASIASSPLHSSSNDGGQEDDDDKESDDLCYRDGILLQQFQAIATEAQRAQHNELTEVQDASIRATR